MLIIGIPFPFAECNSDPPDNVITIFRDGIGLESEDEILQHRLPINFKLSSHRLSNNNLSGRRQLRPTSGNGLACYRFLDLERFVTSTSDLSASYAFGIDSDLNSMSTSLLLGTSPVPVVIKFSLDQQFDIGGSLHFQVTLVKEYLVGYLRNNFVVYEGQ